MRVTASGFSMVELMAAMAILAILAAVGVPSYQYLIASTRMNGEINEVAGALNFARSEAIKRGQAVAVCAGGGASCNSSTDWSSGWLVALSGTVTQLKVSSGVRAGDTLTVTSGSSSYPSFTAMGYTSFTGQLTLKDVNNTPSMYRCIVFSAG